jgi:putative toxin-antitoxin system antitoxin component (TIGR02293 family)
MSVDPEKVAEVMGGDEVLYEHVRSTSDLQRVVAEGLPVGALEHTVQYVAGSRRAAAVLRDRIVPRATRARRTRLRLPESERVERLARLMALAEQVWESADDAREFLAAPHPLLEGRSPLEMGETELGARRVERLLMKLEYGLPV